MKQAQCNCEAGYDQNHSVFCALVRGDEVEDLDELIDYPRAAITEAINMDIE